MSSTSTTPGLSVHQLEDMVKGWFVGAFEPTAVHTDACEVAVRRYRAGDAEAVHHHRIATEVTVVVEGAVRMCGMDFGPGSIITLQPGTATDFLAREDSLCVVVKTPGALNDKYEGAPA
jgi:anti-sigma factor ChrR (cupin superfamily)